jgi:hypothetical protein
MKENEWSAVLVPQMRRCNALVLNVHGEQYQQPGWPDLYVCHRFYRGWIELKGQTTYLESHQRAMIRKLKERGDAVYVARYPNLIQNEEGVLFERFDGTGKGLIFALAELERKRYENLRDSQLENH